MAGFFRKPLVTPAPSAACRSAGTALPIWLALLLVLALHDLGEQLAGIVQQLALPLVHLDRVDGVLSGDILDCLQSALGHELGAVVAMLAHRSEPPFQRRYPALDVNDRDSQEQQSTSYTDKLLSANVVGFRRSVRIRCPLSFVLRIDGWGLVWSIGYDTDLPEAWPQHWNKCL